MIFAQLPLAMTGRKGNGAVSFYDSNVYCSFASPSIFTTSHPFDGDDTVVVK
jgi:hypothetical protein